MSELPGNQTTVKSQYHPSTPRSQLITFCGDVHNMGIQNQDFTKAATWAKTKQAGNWVQIKIKTDQLLPSEETTVSKERRAVLWTKEGGDHST